MLVVICCSCLVSVFCFGLCGLFGGLFALACSRVIFLCLFVLICVVMVVVVFLLLGVARFCYCFALFCY